MATHPSDLAVALAALDAVVVVLGTDGERRVPMSEFHRLPGDTPQHDTTLAQGELVTAVELPALPDASRSAYRKVRDRASYAFALVSVAAVLDVSGGTVHDVRIALGGVAHKPWRASVAEEQLRGGPATEEAFRGRRRGRARRRRAAGRQRLQGADGPQHDHRHAAQPRRRSPMTVTETRASVGTPVTRIDGEAKVLGLAKYAYEQVVENPAYLHPVQATVARGRVTEIDASAAEALEGVLLVLTHLNAPALADTSDQEYAVLQSPGVAFRGQLIGAVVAESPEIARHGAELVRVTYDQHAHDTELARGPPGPLRARPGQPVLPRPTPTRVPWTRRWRPRRSEWTTATRRRWSTTTRWSRTRAPRCGRTVRG